jgi:hypothetical protein
MNTFAAVKLMLVRTNERANREGAERGSDAGPVPARTVHVHRSVIGPCPLVEKIQWVVSV